MRNSLKDVVVRILLGLMEGRAQGNGSPTVEGSPDCLDQDHSPEASGTLVGEPVPSGLVVTFFHLYRYIYKKKRNITNMTKHFQGSTINTFVWAEPAPFLFYFFII